MFSKTIDGVFESNKISIEKAINVLIRNINQIEAETKEYAERISGISMHITALSGNIETQTIFAEKMKAYHKLIEEIRNALDFDNEEME